MIARVQKLELPPGRRILALSDVHGNLPYLRGALEQARYTGDDVLFIVGDLLEKGTRSLETLRWVIGLCKKREVHVSAGNCDWWYPILHDDELLKNGNSLWYVNHKPYNLARQMCAEIGYPVSPEMDVVDMRDTLERAFPEEFDFLRRLPEVIDTPNYTFVHGGLPEGAPETWDAWKCMKRDRFLDEGRSFGKWVICGHWPVMLYGENVVCANPILLPERRIASIDGGCALKDDGQLNVLAIPEDGSFDFSFTAYDPFPVGTALDPQPASKTSWYIRWGDAKVEVLQRGVEFCRCRHLRTGYEMDILTKYVYGDGDTAIVNDCTDYELPAAPGDRVSVVETTSRGYFVKHNGVSGWYRGRIEMER